MRLHVGSASQHDWLSLSLNLGRANFCGELTSSCCADSYAQARSSRGCAALQLSSNRRSLSRLEDALYPSNQRLLSTPEIYTAGRLRARCALASSRSRSGLPRLPVQYHSTYGIRYPNEATIQKSQSGWATSPGLKQARWLMSTVSTPKSTAARDCIPPAWTTLGTPRLLSFVVCSHPPFPIPELSAKVNRPPVACVCLLLELVAVPTAFVLLFFRNILFWLLLCSDGIARRGTSLF
jgi:hypothetical protein